MKSLRSGALFGVVTVLAPRIACAHAGEALEPHDVWSAWEFNPVVITGLLLAAGLYTIGVSRLWKHGPRGTSWWNITCYAFGWISLIFALVSPLHAMGGVLFSAHMAQHEVLMVVAAPLLVLGRPLLPLLWSLPRGMRLPLSALVRNQYWKRTWDALTAMPSAWLLHAAALWVWHIPVLFQATLSSELLHAVQHVSFLGSAVLFTWSLLKHYNGRIRYGAAVAYIFATAVHTSLLGALLTFAHRLWYPAYATTTTALGYSPLEDQQLGGLLMWIPAGILYTIAGLAFFAMWIATSDEAYERSVTRTEAHYANA